MLGREHEKGEKLMGRDFNKMPYKSSILIHSLSSAVIVYAGLLDIYIIGMLNWMGQTHY